NVGIGHQPFGLERLETPVQRRRVHAEPLGEGADRKRLAPETCAVETREQPELVDRHSRRFQQAVVDLRHPARGPSHAQARALRDFANIQVRHGYSGPRKPRKDNQITVYTYNINEGPLLWWQAHSGNIPPIIGRYSRIIPGALNRPGATVLC